MSQARLPRTEPSTELISAHKVNHRAAHVAGRAPGIFAGAGSHRGQFHEFKADQKHRYREFKADQKRQYDEFKAEGQSRWGHFLFLLTTS